jgi:WD40 repeat protein
VLEVPDELAGQAVKCPFCGQVLQAPGRPRRAAGAAEVKQAAALRARWRAMKLYVLSGVILFITTVIVVVGIGHTKFGWFQEGSAWVPGSGKQYRFMPGEVLKIDAVTDRAHAVDPEKHVLDLPSGLLSGLGVGSHSSHLLAAHVGLSYNRIGQTLYDPESGVRIQVQEERITQITVVLKSKELDGESLKAYPGEIRPLVNAKTAPTQAMQIFGQPTDQDEATLTYLTPRRDVIRLVFDPDNTLGMIVLEEEPSQAELIKAGSEAPQRYPESIEPYKLPKWEGEANFDMSSQVCLGMPLGAEIASIAGLPDRIKTQAQGAKAIYPPTGLIIWFDKKRVARLAVFVRPGYSQAQIEAFRGTFSHGIRRGMSMEAVREKLGPENGYSELYRLPILHYVMKDRYLQFGFTPDGEKMVFAGMGLIETTEKDLLPESDSRNLRTARHNTAIWRQQKVLAFAEAGSLFRTVSATEKHYGVECVINNAKSCGWLSKKDARGAGESFVWVSKKAQFRFLQSSGTGKVMDADFFSAGDQIVACGKFTKSGVPGTSSAYHRLCVYRLDRSVPEKSYRSGPISQMFPLPDKDRFLAVHDGKVKLTCTIYGLKDGKQVGGGKFSHASGALSSSIRLSENGKILAAAWKERVVLLEVPSFNSVADLKAPERVLDLALSEDGVHLWTLHDRRVIHWDRQAGTQTPVQIAERQFLYKAPGMPVCLAMARSRQGLMNAVTAYRFPSGEQLWSSDHFYVLPPRLGQTVTNRRLLAAPSTSHRLAVALVDLDSGQVTRNVNLETDETRRLSLSDMAGLKISPKGDKVLAFFKNGLFVTVDMQEEREWKAYQGFYAREQAVSCTSAGDYIALGYQGVKIYHEGKAEHQLELAVPISAIEISSDAHYAAAGDILGQVHVWDLRQEKKIAAFEEDPPLPPITKIRFVLENRAILYSAGNFMSMILVELDPPHRKAPLEQSDKIDHFEVSKDGKMALSMSVGTPTRFYLWDLANKQRVRGISYDQPCNWGAIVFSPDERSATVLLDGRIHLWDFLTGAGRKVTHERLSDAYSPGLGMLSPNGSHLFQFDEEETRIWDIVTGQPVGMADFVVADSAWRFSPDGKALARAVDGEVTVLRVLVSDEEGK